MSGVVILRRAGPFRVEAQVGRGWRQGEPIAAEALVENRRAPRHPGRGGARSASSSGRRRDPSKAAPPTPRPGAPRVCRTGAAGRGSAARVVPGARGPSCSGPAVRWRPGARCTRPGTRDPGDPRRRPDHREPRARTRRRGPSGPSGPCRSSATRAPVHVVAAPISSHDAAKESNLPSGGLPRPAGFEDRMGHQARAAPPRILRGASRALSR
jgi:hypothetical protein